MVVEELHCYVGKSYKSGIHRVLTLYVFIVRILYECIMCSLTLVLPCEETYFTRPGKNVAKFSKTRRFILVIISQVRFLQKAVKLTSFENVEQVYYNFQRSTELV